MVTKAKAPEATGASQSSNYSQQEHYNIDEYGIASIERTQTAPSILETARDYIGRGISVIPLRPRDKRPLFPWSEFQYRFATDEELIRWLSDGKNNIGFVTGRVSGIIVVDFDTAEAMEMAKERGFPATPTVKTARGTHAYFKFKEGIRNFQKRDGFPGIDLRGEGGYVVAPGSIHETGVRYEWSEGLSLDDLPLAELPLWLVSTGAEDRQPVSAIMANGAEEGERNNALTRLAGSFIGMGESLEGAMELSMAWNAARSRPPMDLEEVKSIVQSVYRTHLRNNDGKVAAIHQWSPPSPLPEVLPPVELLDPATIPAPLRGYLVDVAERMQVPIDFATATAIVALGSVIGRGCGIYPKKNDDWLVIPNLWGGVVGRPSMMKTPATAEALRPLMRLETEALEEYKVAAAKTEVDKEVLKLRKASILEEIKKAIKEGRTDDIAEARDRSASNVVQDPTRRRFQTQDGTVEKLGQLLNENPRGILVNRDELIGFLRSMDREGREGDRAFYLESWNGTGRFTYDRIGRGTLDVPALCISIFGAITPGALSQYIREAVRGGKGDDGLLQRFQVMVWPDGLPEWHNIDRFPDTEKKEKVWRIFKALSADIPGAITEDGAPIPGLRFSPEAQELFDDWREKWENELTAGHGLSLCLESHFTKYRSLMPSLALIFHLVAVANGSRQPGPVSTQATISAMKYCTYLKSHARRIYGGTTVSGIEAAKELLKHFNRNDISDGCKPKDIYRNQWSRLATPDDVKAGLEVLADHDWVIVEKIATGGRPSEVIRLNPQIVGSIDARHCLNCLK